MRLVAQILALFALLVSAPVAAQPEFPALTGRVVDNADIIPADVEARLVAELEALETQTQRQLVVTTIPDLEGYDISDYGYQLGREWGLGDADRNDGALLIIAPNDRKVRIEVGYGLEGYLTDAVSSLIIQNQILPRFREGDFPGGITAGTSSIIQQLQLSPDEAARVAQEASQTRQSGEYDGGFPIGTLIWLGFLGLIIFGTGRGRRRKYRAKGKGPWGKRDDDDDDDDRGGWGNAATNIILWEVGSAIARGALSGGGGGGGGGSFGGGFGGGGGSFGGGGASGGW